MRNHIAFLAALLLLVICGVVTSCASSDVVSSASGEPNESALAEIILDGATWEAPPPAAAPAAPKEQAWAPPEVQAETAYSAPTLEPERRPAPTPVPEDPFQAQEELDEVATGSLLDDGVTSVSADAAFALGSAVLNPAGIGALQEVAADAERLPKDAVLEIHGHVDEVGRDAFNQTLAAQRASAAATVLRAALVRTDIALVEFAHGEDDLLNSDCRGDCPANRVVLIRSR